MAFPHPLRVLSEGEEALDLGDLQTFVILFTEELLLEGGVVVEGPFFRPLLLISQRVFEPRLGIEK